MSLIYTPVIVPVVCRDIVLCFLLFEILLFIPIDTVLVVMLSGCFYSFFSPVSSFVAANTDVGTV